MPTIKQSQAVDMSTLTPATVPAAPSVAPSSATETPATGGQSPFMLSSMPLSAATSDLFVRQFYSGGRVPQQRILPVRRATR